MGRWFRTAPKPLGERGEDAAARALRKAGYRILARNAHIGRYEIDIVARDGDATVFVEVKTRRAEDLVAPEANVDKEKQRRLIRAGRAYAAAENNPAMYYRFDVVTVVLPEGAPPEISIYRDAFRPT